jgi:hypothetical protein
MELKEVYFIIIHKEKHFEIILLITLERSGNVPDSNLAEGRCMRSN